MTYTRKEVLTIVERTVIACGNEAERQDGRIPPEFWSLNYAELIDGPAPRRLSLYWRVKRAWRVLREGRFLEAQ